MPNYVKNIVTVSEETMNKIKENILKEGFYHLIKLFQCQKD